MMNAALYAASFLSGFITMSLEMLIGRTLIPYFGGTIYTWGALISVFLSGMAFGYVVGGRMADRTPRPGVVGGLFFVSAISVVIVPVYGEVWINLIIDHVDDVRYAAILASLALACIPAALLAAICPYSVRLIIENTEQAGTISGRFSGLATGGSIVGTLGTTFFFIPLMGIRMIYGVLAGIAVTMGIAFWICAAISRKKRSVAASLWFLAVFSTVLPREGHAQPLDPAAILAKGDGLLERVDSEYNTILIEKRGSLISMNFGYRTNRQTESAIDLKTPDALALTYTRYMTAALAFTDRDVERIALVGLGGGRTISYLVNAIPNAVADVAELDPAVVSLAEKYFGASSNERLRIHTRDGRVFFNQTKDKFDLVLVDAYRGAFVPFHLTTREFYTLLQSRLNEGGIVAQNVEPSTLFFDSSFVTMKKVFDNVDALEAGGNVVLIGYTGPPKSPEQVMARAGIVQQRLGLQYDLRNLVQARRELHPGLLARVLTDDFAPVEMLNTIQRHNERKK